MSNKEISGSIVINKAELRYPTSVIGLLNKKADQASKSWWIILTRHRRARWSRLLRLRLLVIWRSLVREGGE